MLIRSKNKCNLINCENFVITNNAEILGIISGDVSISLGEYNSHDDCVGILDMIQESIVKHQKVFEMPERFWEDIDIENLNISVRSFNFLKKANLKTVKRVIMFDKKQGLESIQGLGRKTLKEIREAISQYENN